ncbi:hypothetical protein T11_11288 [Trichinella zimbabwensis]|uniref:Uncharacterized protein n=1 Tax=Trichinella zimbabwensis TaxID=268475 RepID=A0A0V1HSG9_9BILA|nr:hypothetical protein T11_10432 [Trichinella zimbabwensis]KRZ13691.1 hypothetical protein T11_11288 [Trichinella zimbabwensis]
MHTIKLLQINNIKISIVLKIIVDELDINIRPDSKYSSTNNFLRLTCQRGSNFSLKLDLILMTWYKTDLFYELKR